MSHQMERLRSHAVLHASGVPVRSIRRGMALMMVLPLLALALLSTLVALSVGFRGIGTDLAYLDEVLAGLLPLGGAIGLTALLVWGAALVLGPRIGPGGLRAD